MSKFNQYYNTLMSEWFEGYEWISKSTKQVDRLIEKYKLNKDQAGYLATINNVFGKSKEHHLYYKLIEFIAKNIDTTIEYFYNDESHNLTDLNAKRIFDAFLKYNINLTNLKSFQELIDIVDEKTKSSLSNISEIDPKLAKNMYEDSEKIIIKPLSFEGAKRYGSRYWDITAREEWYRDYLQTHLVLILIFKNNKKFVVDGKHYDKALMSYDPNAKMWTIYDKANTEPIKTKFPRKMFNLDPKLALF